jgi:hypothetical protein
MEDAERALQWLWGPGNEVQVSVKGSGTGKWSTVDSRLSAVKVGRIGADNQNQRINRSTHTQARYTGIKLTGA